MKKLLFISIGILALLFSSCLKDLAPGGNNALDSNKLRLTISVSNLETEGATRASVPSEEGEDRISSLYLLFFEPDEFNNGAFVDYIEVDIPYGDIGMNIETEMDVTGTSINLSQPYNILAVANIFEGTYLSDGESVDLWMEQWEGKTETQVMFEAEAYVKENNTIDNSGLLMNGRFEKVAGRTQINLLLTRNQARLDVFSNISATHDLVSASIWNSHPVSSIWGDGVIDYSRTAHRIRRHYGVDNSANEMPDGTLGNIKGGLYAFENQVASPEQYDQVTTCLIIGLRERGGSGEVTYYRANIHPENSPQSLRRNYAYSLTITGASGPGATTEELAYIGRGNTLEYKINLWNLDDNGLIVADDYSILSIPTKRVTIGRDANSVSLSIYTNTSLTDAAPLSIRSQTYTPVSDDIKAHLDGNTLVIDATAMRLEEVERSGVIVLSFAGLETSISVLQSGTADDYLRVYLPDGGIPRFLSFGGLPSGMIRVEASGPWTAQLYMEGFSFSPTPYTTPVKIIHSVDAGYVENNRFRVYTNSINEGDRARDAFIVITLDKDPDNFVGVVRLSQKNAGAIKLTPEDQTIVTFNGVGGLVDMGSASNTNEFYVNSKIDEGTGKVNGWKVSIIATGSYDDTGFFAIDAQVHDEDVIDNNMVRVKAVGINTTGRFLNAIMRVELLSDPGTYTDITLVQQPAEFNFIPTSVPNVPAIGANSNAVTIDAHESLTWTATVVTNGGTSGARSLVHHEAVLVDEAGDPLGAGPHPMSKKFRVQFPKVYYPNRDLTISATVTVTVGGGLSKTYTVTQSTLTARAMNGLGIRLGTTYGGMGDTYNRGWDGNSGTWGLAQIPGYTGSALTSEPASIAENITYLHFVPQITSTATANSYNWVLVNNFIDTRDAITFIQTQINPEAVNNPNSPLKRAGYPSAVYTGAANPTIYTGHSTTKVYQFVLDKGHTPLTSSQVAALYSDGVSCWIPISGLPSSAVALTFRDGGNAMFIVDIKNKFIWSGESQQFWYDTYLTNNRGIFLDNIMYLVGNAAKYGSHFTDLLLEDTEPGAQPAPWDTDWWGANAGVPSK